MPAWTRLRRSSVASHLAKNSSTFSQSPHTTGCATSSSPPIPQLGANPMTSNAWTTTGPEGPRSRADFDAEVETLEREWAENPRWKGIERPYSAEDVVALRGSFPLRHSLAEHGSKRLWEMLAND